MVLGRDGFEEDLVHWRGIERLSELECFLFVLTAVPLLQKPVDPDALRNALYAAIGMKPRLVLVN
jgi:hypothetical protein